MSVRNVYGSLAEKLKYPESTHLKKLLEKLLTLEEGKLLLELPASVVGLAKKLGKSEDAINADLCSLLKRGLVVSSPAGYDFHKEIMSLWGAAIPVAEELRDPEALRIWKDWYESGWHSDLPDKWVWAESPALRVIPARKALETIRQCFPEQLLPQDDIERLIRDAEIICVHDCDCRLPMGNCCDHPMETCFQFNSGAEYNIVRGAGRKVSADEAMAIIDSCEDNGLVHMAYNRWPVSRIPSLCNCCAKTCIVHDSGIRNGRLSDILAKSRYEATVDKEECIGCQDCVDRCNYNAIDMQKVPGSKKLKANVNPEKCWGCGVCTITCPSGALSMRLSRPESVPGWGEEVGRDNWAAAQHM